MRRPSAAAVVCLLSVAALGRSAGSAATLAELPDRPVDAAPVAAPTTTPPFQPAAQSLSGRVVRFRPGGIVIEAAGREYPVDLRSVVEVWREIVVPASAVAVGDDLFVNGTAGPDVFLARYVWANIASISGVIRSLDGAGLILDIQRSGRSLGQRRIELSAHLEVVRIAGGAIVPADKSDLVPGRTVGMVVYGRPDSVLRATRIWLENASAGSSR